MEISEKLAKYLLDIEAVKLSPNNMFTWASGIKSPIYCDNRKILSYPEIRTYVCNSFVDLIKEKYPLTEYIAGVATGAIAIGALVAEKLSLPFVYVRSSSKSHGLENKVEGFIQANVKVVVIEDLISTGGSSLAAVKSLEEIGCEVLGMCAIFSYMLNKSKENFAKSNCNLDILSNYNVLIQLAENHGYIDKKEMKILKVWRENI